MRFSPAEAGHHVLRDEGEHLEGAPVVRLGVVAALGDAATAWPRAARARRFRRRRCSRRDRPSARAVDRSSTSHSPAMTRLAPARRNAHANPTSPSPEYARSPALRHADTVTSSARSGICATSRAYSLYASSGPERMTAESSGLWRLAAAWAVKCTNVEAFGRRRAIRRGRRALGPVGGDAIGREVLRDVRRSRRPRISAPGTPARAARDRRSAAATARGAAPPGRPTASTAPARSGSRHPRSSSGASRPARAAFRS